MTRHTHRMGRGDTGTWGTLGTPVSECQLGPAAELRSSVSGCCAQQGAPHCSTRPVLRRVVQRPIDEASCARSGSHRQLVARAPIMQLKRQLWCWHTSYMLRPAGSIHILGRSMMEPVIEHRCRLRMMLLTITCQHTALGQVSTPHLLVSPRSGSALGILPPLPPRCMRPSEPAARWRRRRVFGTGSRRDLPRAATR